MRQVLDKLTDYIVVVDLQGIVQYVNKSFLHTLGYTQDEIVQQCMSGIFQMEEKDNFIRQILEDKITNRNIIFKSKESVRTALKWDITLDEWEESEVIVLTTQQIEETGYEWSEIKSFLEVAPFMICIKDIKSGYVYQNLAYKNWIKRSNPDFMGIANTEGFNKSALEAFQKEDEYVIQTKKAIYNKKRIYFNGENTQWYERYKIPIIDKHDEVKHIAIVGKDITLDKKLEDRINESYTALFKIGNTDVKSEQNKILIDLQERIMKELDAVGINVWMYDKENTELVSTFRAGICEEIVGPGEKRCINPDKLKEALKENMYEGIKHLDERKDESLNKEILRQKEIEYVGAYSININNEFLGIFMILYKEDPKQKLVRDELIRRTCNQLGLLIKNKKLSLELNKELQKRIEIEQELEHYLDTATSIMSILDRQGNFIKVNSGITEILGWSKGELLNRNYREILHPEDVPNALAYERKLREDLQTNRKIINKCIHKNGEFVWLEWGIKYLPDKKIFVCTAKDITEEKKMKQQQEFYETKLQTETIKNEFFSNMSHEFKTPLNIIISAMQLMNTSIEDNQQKGISKDELKKYAYYIRQNAYRLLRLVNNVMDITKIDTGFYKLKLGNYNIVEVVEDITLSVAQYIEGKGAGLIFDTEVEEQYIACDPDKIERIMLNLLSNAIKYTDENGEIHVNLAIRFNKVIISVKDNGIGIPQEKLPIIFGRFIQVDDNLNRQNEGSGIGLSLVKALVELHGGIIEVKSILGEGTEFIVEMPIKTLDAKCYTGSVEKMESARVDKCHVEFSDIYTLQ